MTFFRCILTYQLSESYTTETYIFSDALLINSVANKNTLMLTQYCFLFQMHVLSGKPGLLLSLLLIKMTLKIQKSVIIWSRQRDSFWDVLITGRKKSILGRLFCFWSSTFIYIYICLHIVIYDLYEWLVQKKTVPFVMNTHSYCATCMILLNL